MTADHSPPGWWPPQRPRRRGLLDCLPTVLLGAVVLVGLAALLTACSATTIAVEAGFPVIDGEDAVIVQMPDGYADVATACHRGNRLYVSAVGGYGGGAVAVVSADPTCQAAP